MAVEFGAKLYLKDNMYATLKKNLGLQREFSEQVDKTNASMQQMGRTRVNATINATDNASGVSVDTTQSNGFASKDNPDPDTRVWKQSQITYTDGLKAGDMVLVQKLNDNNKYVIIARVVEA